MFDPARVEPSPGDAYVHELAERARKEDGTLRWVVVDDLDEDTCELAVSPWPALQEDGRVAFGERETDHVVVEVETGEFFAVVRDARRLQYGDAATEAVVERPLRVGDVFAAIARTPIEKKRRRTPVGGDRAPMELSLGAEGLADVTVAARTLAKLQVAVAEAAPIELRLLPDLSGDAEPEV